MAAKVVWYREAWWVRTRWTEDGKERKRDRRIGSTKEDRRQAETIAGKVNGALALGMFKPDAEERQPIPFGKHLRDWHRRYSVTFKPRFQETSLSVINVHLVPFFGEEDLREIGETDILEYIQVKLDAGLAPSTILTGLSVVRRVLNLAVRDGLIDRNPAGHLGELMRRVDRRTAKETRVVDSWSRQEAVKLLQIAEEHEPRFAPLLRFLLSTGARRGEALGLRWEDVDFEGKWVTIRRALTKGVSVTPKSGKARKIAIPPSLANELFDLAAKRRIQAMQQGWPEIPQWVFCSEVGTPLEERNVTRSWHRVRRRAQKAGVRPFKLHAARHTFASLALAAGRSAPWVASQLGHSKPEVTLRFYAHAVPVEEHDLSFADFGTEDGSDRLYPAPGSEDSQVEESPDPLTADRGFEILEHETGFEPATLTLAT